MIFSPLEQFIIYPIIQWSNFSLNAILIILVFLLLSKINKILISNHIEWWIGNLNNIKDHIFIILTVWLFILLSNVLGMIPYLSTITAQFILVLSITLPLFIGINLLGISIHGVNILYLILPTGVPIILTPLISVLEIFSYFIRILSLTLRLSANLIAGHILMKILLSVSLLYPIGSIILLPFIVLELMVAFLQAYVYVVLVISYYQDIIVPH